jgi:cleavage and polyadenylation specificity factor subunit 1
MQCYTEVAPPTAVSHAVNLPFLSSKANNVVVAKNSLLQIFEIKSTVTEVAPGGGDVGDTVSPDLGTEVADVPLQRTEHTAKLVLVAEFPLAGTVISLARVKALNTKTKAEALLVAFRDAKLSLVEWDPETFNLNTISIHYYENPDMPGAPWAADLKDTLNFLTADPSSRCAALKFGAHNLAILPFRQRGLAEDEYDSDLEGEQEDQPNGVDAVVNGDNAQQTPYLPSFVLPLTHLDPSLTHPVHLAFLHEYREPTFGIVAASRATAPSLLAERKDILTYTVFTLDLEQKASTTLLSVQGLPYDIFKVVPLPLPIGGALLVGGNEIIHVSQAGKANGVAVNEFAKSSSAFPLSDQSDLALRLEGCAVELLSQETGDVLLILDDGRLLTLTFTLDGRTVSGLTLQSVAPENGGRILKCRASCAVNLGRGRIFVGSEDTDSVVLGWADKSGQSDRKRSQGGVTDDEGSSAEDEDEVDDMDDDLYNDTTPAIKKITAAQAEATPEGAYTFRIHDVLPSLAPIRDVFVNPKADARRISLPKLSDPKSSIEGDLVVSNGRGRAGGVTVLNRNIIPTNLAQTTLESARGLWAVHAKKQAPTGVVTDIGQDTEANLASDVDYDQYLVVCKSGPGGSEETVVYEVNGNEIQETSKGELQREEASTMNVGTLAKGTRVVQVMRTEIRTYDFGELICYSMGWSVADCSCRAEYGSNPASGG